MKKSLLFSLFAVSFALFAKDPQFVIPKIKKAPVIDGQMTPGEWQNANAMTMFGYYNRRGWFNLEQPVFYTAWDDKYIYVAMDCRESTGNAIAAGTIRNDFASVVGDDSVELMFAAGTGQKILDPDFHTYYIALNYLGAVWDAMFKPQRNECHNTWQSAIDVKSKVNGTRWVMECRVPIKSVTLDPVKAGTKWRSNFCRTFYRYNWVALNPAGALNDARIGADMTFGDEKTPVVRMGSIDSLFSGTARIELEIYNPSKKEVTLTATLTGESRESEGAKEFRKINHTAKIKLKPGERRQGIMLGNQRLSWYNELLLSVKDDKGTAILEIPRKIVMPAQRLKRMIAPATPSVLINTVYHHSKDRLDISFDIKKWLERSGVEKGTFLAEINITEKKNKVKPVKVTFDQFNTGTAVWSMSTKDLPEGDYDIAIEITSKGKSVEKNNDWFEKRKFDWLNKPILPANVVPAPYEPLKAKGNTLTLWGREYRFAPNGFPVDLITQKKDYVIGDPVLYLTRNGKEFPLEVSTPFKFTEITPRKVSGKATVKGGGLTFDIISETEYDGFILYKVVCKTGWFSDTVDRLRLKMPLDGKYIKFLSASGDTTGVSIPGKVIPPGDGRIYDSVTHSRSVVMTPSFASMLWLADHDISFCYAADTDKDWILNKDKPAVEVYRKGNNVDLYLNLIDVPAKLTKTHTMEFAFQTGPTKPRPAGWREFQDVTNNQIGAPGAPKYRVQIGGDGFTTHGGTHSLHPGTTPELRKKSKEKIEKIQNRAKNPKNVHVVGYQYYGYTVKGFQEARVFRSEWGISANSWQSGGNFDSHKWGLKTYGQNRDNYYFIHAPKFSPSYIDFLAHAYDGVLATTNLYGFYDDVGYPRPVYNPEYGYGYKKDGQEYYSSGIWLYRKRWKSVAEVNAKHNRLNLLGDTQHLHSHFMPAYNFIGVFAPCEQGYYNPFPEKDAFEFYGSMENYAAMNPAKQTGQIPIIGLSSSNKDFEKFAQDTRVMFMLTAMNDHSLGSFGRREQWTIDRLSAARALFRQWEKDVTFVGYWQNANLCKVSDPKVLLSAYTRKGQALWMFGNTGSKTTTFKVTPDFAKLGIKASECVLIDAETQKVIPFNGKDFTLTLKKHDIAMVLAGKKGVFKLYDRLDWDKFLGKSNVKKFKTYMPATGENGSGEVAGRNYVFGHHGGFMQAATALPGTVKEVSALIGSNTVAALAWDNNVMVGAIRGARGTMSYTLPNGKSAGGKNKLTVKAEGGWFPYAFTAVKYVLTPEAITVYVSDDAKTWKQDIVIKREAKTAAAPKELFIGRGHKGKAPFMRNLQKYYAPSPRYPNVYFFGNIKIK